MLKDGDLERLIGKKRELLTSIDVAIEYERLSKSHLQAAEVLYNNGLYNESVYFYIQAMEKKIDEKICRKIDVTNPYFAERMRETSHSIDKSIEFLIEIYSGSNKNMYAQIRNQIIRGIFKNIKFAKLHNNVRYPAYNSYKSIYNIYTIEKNECNEIREMGQLLMVFLNDLERI